MVLGSGSKYRRGGIEGVVFLVRLCCNVLSIHVWEIWLAFGLGGIGIALLWVGR